MTERSNPAEAPVELGTDEIAPAAAVMGSGA
jgi:hypothetical protein